MKWRGNQVELLFCDSFSCIYEIQIHCHGAPLDHAHVEATTWANPHERVYTLVHHLVEMSRHIQTCHLLWIKVQYLVLSQIHVVKNALEVFLSCIPFVFTTNNISWWWWVSTCIHKLGNILPLASYVLNWFLESTTSSPIMYSSLLAWINTITS